MGPLEKYMLKSGKDRSEVKGVLKKAGQKQMSEKLEDESHQSDTAQGHAADEYPKKDTKHWGEERDVKDDHGKDVDEGEDEEFNHEFKGKKKKKAPEYLED